MKVGAYIRRSTDESHQPYTLRAQTDSIANYVKSQGPEWQIVSMHEDSASGKSMKREGLETLLSRARDNEFDIVVVYKIDRISRRLRDFVEIIHLLNEAGVSFRSVTEPIDTASPMGRAFMNILAVFAEFESDLIVERTVAGMNKKAELGEWCGGTVPYGYSNMKKEKTLIANEKEAAIVERIYQLYVKRRMGARSIAKKLNTEGHRTKNSRNWSVDAIIRILRSPLYTGNIIRNGKVYPGKHSYIVTPQIWENTQQILNERRDSHSLRRSNGSDYLLSGLLRCSRCKASLVGMSAYGRNKRYDYYCCSCRTRYGECDLPRMSKQKLEEAILGQLREILQNDNLVTKLVKKVNERSRVKAPDFQRQLRLVEQKIIRTENLADLYFESFAKEGSLSRLVETKLNKIALELEQLKETQSGLRRKMKAEHFHSVNSQDIKKILNDVEGLLLQASPGEAKGLLRLLIKRVDIQSPESIQPYYMIPLVRIESGLAPRAGLEPTT